MNTSEVDEASSLFNDGSSLAAATVVEPSRVVESIEPCFEDAERFERRANEDFFTFDAIVTFEAASFRLSICLKFSLSI